MLMPGTDQSQIGHVGHTGPRSSRYNVFFMVDGVSIRRILRHVLSPEAYIVGIPIPDREYTMNPFTQGR